MEVILEGKSEIATEEIRRNTEKTDRYESVSAGETALENQLNKIRMEWLCQYVCERFRVLHQGLFHWRAKMQVWEEMSEDDYSNRITEPNPDKPELAPDIFRVENGSMGLSSGFVDFASAQARGDIFGTRPWLAATPEGSDRELANTITKHAQWKFDQSNLQETLIDAIKVACWGGTAFVKPRWDRQVENYRTAIAAAWSMSENDFILGPDGDYITDAETLMAMGITDGSDIEWKDRYVEEPITIYDNVRADLIDWRDIAFDEKAAHLDLSYTDVFHRFRVGLLDAVHAFGIPEEYISDLRNAIVGYDEEVREERGETASTTKTPGVEDDEANPTITLVEGYVRVNIEGTTSPPVRIHVVFSEELNMIFRADYLANVTPGALLPIFPVRIHKISRRIFGRGYFEKYKADNDAVDRHHNVVSNRNQLSSQVITAFQPEALLDENEGKDGMIDITKPFILKPGMTIQDLVSFASFPDLNSRSIELMNQRMQIAQMKSGITSAAQGELKGVPNASTATGVMQLQSRGALLLKDQVDTISFDVERVVEYSVHLNYANLDHDEAFTWGEGAESELFTIKAADVQGLRMNVSLTLVQAQNQAKFQSAQAGMQVASQYAMLPEHEKQAQRMLFIEALQMLGFNEAPDIIRDAVVDPASLLVLLPPDQAALAQAAFVQAGLMAPPEGQEQPAGEEMPPTANVTPEELPLEDDPPVIE